jgi:soluble lytic murein transglycosylase
LLAPDLFYDESKDPKSLELYLIKISHQSPKKNEVLWAQYMLAKLWSQSNPIKSCELFTSLSEERLFPLKKEALLHKHLNCEKISFNQQDISETVSVDIHPWLKEFYFEVLKTSSQRSNDKNSLIQAHIEMSKYSIDQSIKISHMQKARDLTDPTDLKQLNYIDRRIEKIAPRFLKNPRSDQLLKVAADFRNNREFSKAQRMYYSIIKANHKNKESAIKGLAQTYKILGDKEKHIHYLNALNQISLKQIKSKNSKKNAEELLQTTLQLARAHWTQGQLIQTDKILQTSENILINKHPVSEIYWIRGRMSEEKQEFQRAINWFDKALLNDPSPALKEKLLWAKAWNLYKSEKFEESISTFLNLINEETTENQIKYKFWLAKSYLKTGNTLDSKKLFEEIQYEDPLGFYGILSQREISKPLSLPNNTRRLASDEHSEFKEKQTLTKYMDTIYLDWLIQAKEYSLTENYLHYTAKSMQSSDSVTSQDWLALFNYYARAGQYIHLYTQLGKLQPEIRRDVLSRNTDLIFPKPYLYFVSDSSRKFGVSMEYIYSIMRQESAFNPRARSHMDALGLMQLLPSVAKISAQENHIPFENDEDLYVPKVAIELGAAYLRTLWDKYQGRFILATASYNANEKAIENWLSTRFRGDSVEFIEDIPYEETKGYVKLVMRNFIFYKILNSQESSIEFPDWVLKL